MNSVSQKFHLPFMLFALVFSFTVGHNSSAEDFRGKSKRATLSESFEENKVAQMAIALGRTSGAIKTEEIKSIIDSLNAKRNVPAALAGKWQKLIRISQTLLYLKQLPYYFSHGYEFETMKRGEAAYDIFDEGAVAVGKLIASHFGGEMTDVDYDEFEAKYKDDSKREWLLTLDTVRMNDAWDGFEVVTPPFFKPEEVEKLVSFVWRLGEQSYGSSGPMTGGHQTYGIIPQGASQDPHLAALALTNYILLRSQYAPAMFELLEVRRMGGPENFFFRPLIFDHHELLTELSKVNPNRLSMGALSDIFNRWYVDKEFAIQLENQRKNELIEYDEDAGETAESVYAEMLTWPVEKKISYKPVWKYRDIHPKFNLADPIKTLVEDRVGDYIQDRPEQVVLQTYLNQKLLGLAWQMALKNQVFKFKTPVRAAQESTVDFWKRVKADPSMSVEALFKTLGIQDENEKNFLTKKSFTAKYPAYSVLPSDTYAFEIEGYTFDVVDLILPRDPKKRLAWREMSYNSKINLLKKLGINFDKETLWTVDERSTFSSEFIADTDRFPFLSNDVIVEPSGNWEIKSNSRGFAKLEDVTAAVNLVDKEIPDDNYGIHLHNFMSVQDKKGLAPAKAKEFTRYLQQLSFYMAVVAYRESDVTDAPHYLDSWSLDRYSVKDLQQVESYLLGRTELNSLSQKYHNVGFRPVQGGLDLELRDCGDTIQYCIELMRELRARLVSGEFGLSQAPAIAPLFMGFGEGAVADEAKFSVVGALAKRRALTAPEQDLLSKLQFEIYKPLMRDYVYFADFATYEETSDADLDVTNLRSNFENNLSIPLLNYEDQPEFTAVQLALISKNREMFLNRVEALLKRISADSSFDFISKNQNFLHLADWLKRSTHKSRPDFSKVTAPVAKKQRELLESLVAELRGYVVQFVQSTRIDSMVKTQLMGPKIAPAVVAKKTKGSATDTKPTCDDILVKD